MAEEYRIVLQPAAYEGMEAAYNYIEQESLTKAQQWANGLMDSINSLQTYPERCSLAPEDEYFPQQIRQLLYRSTSGVYRILFTVSEDAVVVLYIRYSAQRMVTP